MRPGRQILELNNTLVITALNHNQLSWHGHYDEDIERTEDLNVHFQLESAVGAKNCELCRLYLEWMMKTLINLDYLKLMNLSSPDK